MQLYAADRETEYAEGLQPLARSENHLARLRGQTECRLWKERSARSLSKSHQPVPGPVQVAVVVPAVSGARELVETVRNNVTIDWTVREAVRARLRVMVKRILRKYGYLPDKQERATQTVSEQAALIAKDWAE